MPGTTWGSKSGPVTFHAINKNQRKEIVFSMHKSCCGTEFIFCAKWEQFNKCWCNAQKQFKKLEKWGKVEKMVFLLDLELITCKCDTCGDVIAMLQGRLDSECRCCEIWSAIHAYVRKGSEFVKISMKFNLIKKQRFKYGYYKCLAENHHV